MSRYLVVGKNGYIAKAFAERKIAHEKIYTSSHASTGDNDVFYLDLTEPENFDYSVIKKDTFILLLAANSSPDSCLNNYEDAYKLNVTGTVKFIENCINRNARVLFFSSDTVYGDTNSDVDELSDINPIGEYAKMKNEVEKKFLLEKNFKVIRLSYVLSKEDKFMKYILNAIKSGDTIEVFEPFDRAVIYVQDVVDAILLMTANWNEVSTSVLNLAGPDVISRAVIARYINQIYPGAISFKVAKPDEDFYRARPKKINMKSRYLSQILQREPTSIIKALEVELKGLIK